MTESSAFLNYLLPGITLGFAAAVQPGPLSLYLVSRTLTSGWKRAFPAVFAPLITDGPIALLCLLILGNMPPAFLKYIQIPGGLFILFLAYQAGKSWKRKGSELQETDISSGRTLVNAVVVNFLNPSPYLGWSLVIGPIFLKGWTVSPANGTLLLTGFYLTLFSVTTLLIILFDLLRDRGRLIQRILLGLSAMLLGAYGLYQIVTGVMS